jgi:hypothetical protein
MAAAGAMVLLSGLLGGCNSLDKVPLTNISAEDVWSDPGFANAFVNARYRSLFYGWAESNQSSVVDETYLIWDRGCTPYTKGTVDPSNLGRMNGAWWGSDMQGWSNVYTNISNCNIFLERAADVPYSEEERDRRIGEMTFLRALQYHNLVSRWGGLPLVTKKFTLDDIDEFSTMKRNNYTDCIDFIVSECDKAASLLPAKYTNEADIGRATSVAALALKSRVLLYSASPLMNQTDVNPLVGHTTPDPQRWEKAAAAAKACIDAALAAGYAMYNAYPDDVKMNYTRMFWDGGNSEILFDKKGGTSAVGASLHNVSQTNGPNGYGVWGGNVPISEFVDDFEMSDGTPFDWNNPVHRANPYANRDGRLYAYVLCDGDQWRDRKVETYFVRIAGSDSEYDPNLSGRDTQYGMDNWNTSTSGYNLRKWMDEEYAPNSNLQPNPRFWPYFRLAEIYLNLAEALYHTGDEAGALAAMNMVRTRAKLPDATQTGDELLAKIKHERRIELAFEEHRYYDLRRWLDAEEVLNRDATGVTIVLDPATGVKTYTPGRLVEERAFRSPAMYWMPIPLGEIEKNPNIEQNPGYKDQTNN